MICFQYLQLVPPTIKPRAVPAPAPVRRAPPSAPSAPSAPIAPVAVQSSRMADSNSAPVSVMPGMGGAGGLQAILAAKRAALAAEESSPPSSSGNTPVNSRPGSALGKFQLSHHFSPIINSFLTF